ncbi:MAG: DUF4230 domain-containing protein [Cyclobacteriaceae bacterium]
MKTSNYIPAFLFLCGAALGILLYREFRKEPTSQPQQLTLEQILSIRELHLVKHTYNDLFFLHRKNNPAKPIRAMVQVPVTITAYLNLKDIELVYSGDSIQKLILPRASLNEPVYHINRVTIRETRSFQIHAGKDLYPLVGSYLGEVINARMDTTRSLAITNRILLQAEAEGMEYIKTMLHTVGHKEVLVTFNDEIKDKEVDEYLKALHKNDFVPVHPTYTAHLDAIPFGFLPLPLK